MNALNRYNNTYNLVSLPSVARVSLDFMIKSNKNVKEKYQAHFVTKGNSQILDAIVIIMFVPMLIQLTVQYSLFVSQIDDKTVYLNVFQ